MSAKFEQENCKLLENFEVISTWSSNNDSNIESFVEPSELDIKDDNEKCQNILKDNIKNDFEIEEKDDDKKKKKIEKSSSNIDLEYDTMKKYIKCIIHNKEKEEFYEFMKYLCDSDLFLSFVQFFLYVIKNKDSSLNPHDYLINFFQINMDEENNTNSIKKKKLIKENNIYKKQNEELKKQINIIQVEIMDLKKKNMCNLITNFFFKNNKKEYDATKIFKKVNLIYENITIEPPFHFTKDTFNLFLNYLSDKKRNYIYNIITDMDSMNETNHNLFIKKKKLYNKLIKFIEFYRSFDNLIVE
ncbi:hypothetical protein PGSY75_0620600 [Plasmodium gaboni]|uniref:Uncharacterized protein n=1 Tax=Plasmodium gaboni TaxID=647221 RepID=A0A151LRT8_9APIC|nr:hypothetical protein PGSY75_0620600 [Plasmodium gaboni]KYO01900.1 hypothetical protein PGSY75_0620600 [Plasmodium gaboni]